MVGVRLARPRQGDEVADEPQQRIRPGPKARRLGASRRMGIDLGARLASPRLERRADRAVSGRVLVRALVRGAATRAGRRPRAVRARPRSRAGAARAAASAFSRASARAPRRRCAGGASAGLRLRRQARQRNGRRDDERALGAASGAARAAPRRPLVGPSRARHGQARSARVAICRHIARARRRLARRIGALRARRRRVRLARRDRQRRSGAHRRVDRSARLHQQTAAAVEGRRAGKAGKRRYAGEFGAHRARGPPAGRDAHRGRSDALDAGGAQAGRRRAERASLRHPRRRQIHPASRRLALGRLRDFGDALRQADDRVDRPAAIEPRGIAHAALFDRGRVWRRERPGAVRAAELGRGGAHAFARRSAETRLASTRRRQWGRRSAHHQRSLRASLGGGEGRHDLGRRPTSPARPERARP